MFKEEVEPAAAAVLQHVGLVLTLAIERHQCAVVREQLLEPVDRQQHVNHLTMVAVGCTMTRPAPRTFTSAARPRRWSVALVVSPRQDDRVLIARATKKLLQRVGPPTLQEGEQSTTLLGQWYATALFWNPQVALLVNETTLLHVLMPLAPAATLPTRVAQQIATVLAAHGTPKTIIDEELQHMRDCRVARTANRSVVGIMNEFTYLAKAYRDDDPGQDLLDLAVRLATTPCSPLYSRNVSPNRELAAILRSIAT